MDCGTSTGSGIESKGAKASKIYKYVFANIPTKLMNSCLTIPATLWPQT